MISKLQLKVGSGPGAAPLSLDLTPITVFVGPNNSGKSLVLQEIYQFCTNWVDLQHRVLDTLTFKGVEESQAQAAIQALIENVPTGTLYPGNVLLVGNGQRMELSRRDLVNTLQEPNPKVPVLSQYMKLVTLKLDGATRLQHVREQAAGDLQRAPTNSLHALVSDHGKRLTLRRAAHEAFGLHLVVDPTNLGKLRLRLSSTEPVEVIQELGIHPEAVKFHNGATSIEEMSDGVRAYTGIMLEVIAGDPKVLVIDEPEAFLHPSLAFTLGKQVSTISRGTEKRLFISTHSPWFIMGCLQSGAPVNIVRLTYRRDEATARVLANDELVKLMRDPLLRSTGMLGGLFYESLVITEADTDRAFYNEINERLLQHKPDSGIPNCLFLNAQNKQTIRRLLGPLRALGIPCAAIVDIDVLKEGGTVWTSFLSSGAIPEPMHEGLGNLRAKIKNVFAGASIDMKRDGGVGALSGENREAAENLFQQLAEYGLFVVPNGEVESWLKQLQVAGHGPNWLIDVFTKMGENPDDPGYLKPASGDVWAFLVKVRTWLMNASRKGIPL